MMGYCVKNNKITSFKLFYLRFLYSFCFVLYAIGNCMTFVVWLGHSITYFLFVFLSKSL